MIAERRDKDERLRRAQQEREDAGRLEERNSAYAATIESMQTQMAAMQRQVLTALLPALSDEQERRKAAAAAGDGAGPTELTSFAQRHLAHHVGLAVTPSKPDDGTHAPRAAAVDCS